MAKSGGRDDKVEALRGLPWAAGAADEDLRWLARVADGFRRRPGATVARAAAPSRWAYVVVTGDVVVAGEVHGPGAYVLPDADVVALGDVEVLAFPRTEEPGLGRRFPGALAPAAAPRRPHCPTARLRAVVVAARPA
jgi:hypothetical protein